MQQGIQTKSGCEWELQDGRTTWKTWLSCSGTQCRGGSFELEVESTMAQVVVGGGGGGGRRARNTIRTLVTGNGHKLEMMKEISDEAMRYIEKCPGLPDGRVLP